MQKLEAPRLANCGEQPFQGANPFLTHQIFYLRATWDSKPFRSTNAILDELTLVVGRTSSDGLWTGNHSIEPDRLRWNLIPGQASDKELHMMHPSSFEDEIRLRYT